MSSTLSKEEILAKNWKLVYREQTSGYNGSIFKLSHEAWVGKAMDEYAQQESRKEAVELLKWLLLPNNGFKISSGEDCWYVDGEEKTHSQVVDLYIQSKQKQK